MYMFHTRTRGARIGPRQQAAKRQAPFSQARPMGPNEITCGPVVRAIHLAIGNFSIWPFVYAESGGERTIESAITARASTP